MSRHQFAEEGIVVPIGLDNDGKMRDRIITPGAIKWDDREIDVCWNFRFDDVRAVMGKATDIRREDNKLTAEIDWHPDYRVVVEHGLDKDFTLSFYGNELNVKKVEQTDHIDSVLVRCIGAIVSGGNPGAKL